METIEKIDLYISGKMEQAEKFDFEKLLESDLELKKQLSKQLMAIEAIKLASIKAEVKAAQLEYLENEGKNVIEKPKIKLEPKYFSLRIAASIAILLLGLSTYQFVKLNTGDILEKNEIKYIEPVLRSVEPNENKIEELYKAENYLKLLEVYNAATNHTDKEQFLAAMANYNLKNYSKSLNLLKKLENSENNPQKQDLYFEIKYFKALNLIGTGSINEALLILENIKKDKNNPYSSAISNSLLLKLKILKLKN